MSVERHGGCSCGELRYTFSCDILSCYACHCLDCQTRSGSAFTLSAIVPASALSVTKGIPKKVSWEVAISTMCSNCGIHLWSIPNSMPDFATIRVGTLDDTTWVNPVAHIWTVSAQSWVRFNGNAKQFARQPKDPKELLKLWAQRLWP